MYGGVKGLWRKARFTILFQRDAPFFIDIHVTGGQPVMLVSGGVENGAVVFSQGVAIGLITMRRIANEEEFRCV